MFDFVSSERVAERVALRVALQRVALRSSERVAIHRSQDSLPPFSTGIVAHRRSVTGIRLYGFSVSDGLSPGAVGLFDLHKKSIV